MSRKQGVEKWDLSNGPTLFTPAGTVEKCAEWRFQNGRRARRARRWVECTPCSNRHLSRACSSARRHASCAAPNARAAARIEEGARPLKRTTISFFGNFGTQNLGNEYTLQAIIHNVRKHLPEAKLNCICTDPEDASARHKVPAFLISYRYDKGYRSRVRRDTPLIRWLRRFLIRLPLELIEWLKAFRTLKGTRMLVMTGTGMLGDFGIGPFDLHYEILKWSLLAKLRRAKLLFVSVGAGPIAHPLSRRIVKLAISLADYRSYRDSFSKEYLASIGFDTKDDFVYPDLAFSLRPRPPATGRRNSRVVGLGLMDYYGKGSTPEYDETTYQNYLDGVTSFAAWLLDRKYTVRLLIGDVSYDKRVTGDVIKRLKERDGGQIIDEPVSSVEQLIAQLAATDIVVATRFHNILLALMLNKPVVALSYHEKIASLMAGVGLAEYCQRTDQLDVARLKEQFDKLEQNAGTIKPALEQKIGEYGRALEQQYVHIFNHLYAASPGMEGE
jgi:polysaccharide pyruvyl transferase WcaK-like protein